jgi:hypothetical protein
MVDYVTPMDQAYHAEIQHANRRTELEAEPLFPLHMIGQTVPETDPATRRDIIGNVDAAFKAGAGNIQIVMMTTPSHGEVIGGGAKGYGEEVRRAIREMQQAAGAKITGVEMPTAINNLSGYSQNQFSEQMRKLHLEEVKDAIKFVGDIAGGGTVDIVGFEYQRNFSDASWKDNKLFKQKEEEVARLVDADTGGIIAIDKRQKFFLPVDLKTGRSYTEEDFEKGKATFNPVTWRNFEDWAKKQSNETGKRISAEELFMQQTREQKLRSVAAQESSVKTHYNEALMHLSDFKREKEKAEKQIQELSRMSAEQKELLMRRGISPEEVLEEAKERLKILPEREGYYNEILKTSRESLKQIEAQKKEIESEAEKIKTIDEYGVAKTSDSYAEAGIWAMQESQKNQYVQRGKGAISVGPEIGWPQFYGGHPTEWVNTIKKSRERMVERLTSEKIKDEATGQEIKNPYFDPNVSKSEAENLAKRHIKGMFDTSHMGMWLQNFKPELPWDKRVSEFKKWYKDQVEWIADQNKKYDILGGIQMVDSASGQHGHLPAGQGILGKDMYDYMKILKEKGGYKGEVTSEGHEEERFGQGRILTKAWETLGAPISMDYFHGKAAPRFSDIAHSYAQIAYGTTGIFRAYVPSNDFALWSEVPFE